MIHSTGEVADSTTTVPIHRKHSLLTGRPPLILMLFFLIYCTIFSTLSILKYQAFNNDLDTGNMLQAFYGTLHGRFMEMTWNGVETNACMWQGHTEIVFLLMFPFFALFPYAQTLLILQTIAIGAGAIAVYLLASHLRCGKTIPIVLSVCYWLYPLLAAINLVDFHADAFIIAPYLFAWYFQRTGQARLFWITITIAILVKEHAFLFNALLGCALIGTDRRRGLILLVLSVTQLVLLTPAIQHMAGSSAYHLTLAQHVVGNPHMSAVETITTFATRFADNLFSINASFVFIIALTLNISIFLFPRGLILIVPLVMIFIATGSVQNHRHAILIAPLFITLVEGIARIPVRHRKAYAIFGVLVPTMVVLITFPDSLLGTNIRELRHPHYRNVFHYRHTAHDAIADSLIRLIPPDAPIAADAPLRSKLVNREWAFIHPSPTDSMRADYYLFDFFEKREYDDAWPARTRVASLLRSGNFSLMTNNDGLVIVRKEVRNDASNDFRLDPVTPVSAPPSGSCMVSDVGIDSANGWFVMKMRFYKGALDSTRKHAFISLFIDTTRHDTLRVLHLATYTMCRLEKLDEGWYDELFAFNLPDGEKIDDLRHEIWLFAKDGYLPFPARPEYRIRCCWKSQIATAGAVAWFRGGQSPQPIQEERYTF